MSGYVKFMKDILSKKRKLGDYETMALSEECSAILPKKLSPKLKDPSSFTIPCAIGNLVFEKSLCDIGASINLIPWSIFKKLKLGEARPTTVTLQLADDPSLVRAQYHRRCPSESGQIYLPFRFYHYRYGGR